MSLHTSSYVPDQDAHSFWSSATNEITGTGYTTLGAVLGTKSVTYDTATNETRLIAANTSWSSATFTAAIAVVYKNTGTAATSPLLGWVDFGGNETVTSGTFTIQWDSTGVLKVAAA